MDHRVKPDDDELSAAVWTAGNDVSWAKRNGQGDRCKWRCYRQLFLPGARPRLRTAQKKKKPKRPIQAARRQRVFANLNTLVRNG